MTTVSMDAIQFEYLRFFIFLTSALIIHYHKMDAEHAQVTS